MMALVRRLVIAALATAALATVIVIAPAASAGTPGIPAIRYVALGDSFTAGWGVGTVAPDEPSTGCGQSEQDYPHRVAAALRLQLHDVSCAGATTAAFTQPQTEFPNVSSAPPAAPQFDALSADTALVTVGIGGNDFGFADIAQACARNPITGYVFGGPNWPYYPYYSYCQDYYDPGGLPANDKLRARIVQHVGPAVQRAVAAIHSHAPHALVYFVDYLAIAPDRASAPNPATYPNSCYSSLFNADSFPFGGKDVSYLAATESTFNSTVDAAARAAGATVVSPYRESLSHSPCAGTSAPWVSGITVNYDGSVRTGSLHPNAAGTGAQSIAVLSALRRLRSDPRASRT